MRGPSAEHLQEAVWVIDAVWPLRAIGIALLLWAVGSTLLVGGIGAWIALCRRWRARD